MRRVCLSCAILLLLAAAPGLRAEDSERGVSASFDAQRFYRDVRKLVRRHYPDATAHRLRNKIHFAKESSHG